MTVEEFKQDVQPGTLLIYSHPSNIMKDACGLVEILDVQLQGSIEPVVKLQILNPGKWYGNVCPLQIQFLSKVK